MNTWLFDDKDRTFNIEKEDAIKAVYFICRLTQNQGNRGMSGVLSTKQDLIGGIFDRWINIIPESIVFNKGILPKISNGKKVEVITDYYSYDPSSDKAGIAPDVIGLRINHNIVPFVQFNEKWCPVNDMPQIELKTFKKTDYMVSLRNQGYDEKYLVMVQSEFRVDYLIPYFDQSIFNDSIYNEMKIDDSKFVISNNNHFLNELEKVDISNNNIGKVSLIKITRADAFMRSATHCEQGVSVEWLKKIELADCPKSIKMSIPLSSLCFKNSYNLYTFNEKWYSGINEEGIPYRSTKKRNGIIENTKVRTLDFYVDDIDAIEVIRMAKYSLTIRASKDAVINGVEIKKDNYYLLSYSCLPRENSGEEYFMQKDLICFVDSYEKELTDKLEAIVKNN